MRRYTMREYAERYGFELQAEDPGVSAQRLAGSASSRDRTGAASHSAGPPGANAWPAAVWREAFDHVDAELETDPTHHCARHCRGDWVGGKIVS